MSEYDRDMYKPIVGARMLRDEAERQLREPGAIDTTPSPVGAPLVVDSTVALGLPAQPAQESSQNGTPNEGI